MYLQSVFKLKKNPINYLYFFLDLPELGRLNKTKAFLLRVLDLAECGALQTSQFLVSQNLS